MTGATETSVYRTARWVAVRWVEWYTEDLDRDAAWERRSELASEIWEHGSDADEVGAARWPASMELLSRTVRGIPADLSWRLASGRAARRQLSPLRRWEASGLIQAAALTGLVVAGSGLAVLARILLAITRSQYVPPADIGSAVAASTTAAAIGTVLLLRDRTRWLGPLWIGVAGVALIQLLGPAAFSASTTLQTVYYDSVLLRHSPGWAGIGAAAAGCLAVFSLCLAAAWFPGPTSRMNDDTKGSR